MLTQGETGTWTCISSGAYPQQKMAMRIESTIFPDSQFTSNLKLENKLYTATGTLTWSPTIANNGQRLYCDVTHPETLNDKQTASLLLTVKCNYVIFFKIYFILEVSLIALA